MIYPRIKKLSPIVINQIAAGEVVTRPAAVVKELVENAVDAHAKKISIHISQGGMGLIEVSDDGDGIHADDMVLALSRHATSKLVNAEALAGVSTLGFRGEALASIAAVARLRLSSSNNHSGVGVQLSLAGQIAEDISCRAVAQSKGTVVSVRDLFFNVPARRASLKSIATEFNHIETLVCQFAMQFADVQFELWHNDQLRLRFAVADLSQIPQTQQSLQQQPLQQQRLQTILGQTTLATAHAFRFGLPLDSHYSAAIYGWLFDPSLYQTRQLFINQRIVRNPQINQAVNKAARMAGAKSVSFMLFIGLPTPCLNANVHPSKQQVNISQLQNLCAQLCHQLQQQLQQAQQQWQAAPRLNITTEQEQKPILKTSTPTDEQNNASVDYTQTTKQQSSANIVAQPLSSYQLQTPLTTQQLPVNLQVVLLDGQATLSLLTIQPPYVLLQYQQQFLLVDIAHYQVTRADLVMDADHLKLLIAWLTQQFTQVTLEQLQQPTSAINKKLTGIRWQPFDVHTLAKTLLTNT